MSNVIDSLNLAVWRHNLVTNQKPKTKQGCHRWATYYSSSDEAFLQEERNKQGEPAVTASRHASYTTPGDVSLDLCSCSTNYSDLAPNTHMQ